MPCINRALPKCSSVVSVYINVCRCKRAQVPFDVPLKRVPLNDVHVCVSVLMIFQSLTDCAPILACLRDPVELFPPHRRKHCQCVGFALAFVLGSFVFALDSFGFFSWDLLSWNPLPLSWDLLSWDLSFSLSSWGLMSSLRLGIFCLLSWDLVCVCDAFKSLDP